MSDFAAKIFQKWCRHILNAAPVVWCNILSFCACALKSNFRALKQLLVVCFLLLRVLVIYAFDLPIWISKFGQLFLSCDLRDCVTSVSALTFNVCDNQAPQWNPTNWPQRKRRCLVSSLSTKATRRNRGKMKIPGQNSARRAGTPIERTLMAKLDWMRCTPSSPPSCEISWNNIPMKSVCSVLVLLYQRSFWSSYRCWAKRSNGVKKRWLCILTCPSATIWYVSFRLCFCVMLWFT